MTPTRTLVAAAAFAAAAALVPSTVDARGAGGGHVASGGHWHGGSGHWRGGHWRHHGHWHGAFWGGVGFGLGLGTIGYWGPYGYYPAYVGPAWRTVVYDAPLVAAPVYGVEPTRIGQAVPQVAPAAPDPIFYPRNGQNAETTENDRRDCNRWATTQRGAMADATIFQRATLACMEGRGYTVK